jgi:hypothetical protein
MDGNLIGYKPAVSIGLLAHNSDFKEAEPHNPLVITRCCQLREPNDLGLAAIFLASADNPHLGQPGSGNERLAE